MRFRDYPTVSVVRGRAAVQLKTKNHTELMALPLGAYSPEHAMSVTDEVNDLFK